MTKVMERLLMPKGPTNSNSIQFLLDRRQKDLITRYICLRDRGVCVSRLVHLRALVSDSLSEVKL